MWLSRLKIHIHCDIHGASIFGLYHTFCIHKYLVTFSNLKQITTTNIRSFLFTVYHITFNVLHVPWTKYLNDSKIYDLSFLLENKKLTHVGLLQLDDTRKLIIKQLKNSTCVVWKFLWIGVIIVTYLGKILSYIFWEQKKTFLWD